MSPRDGLQVINRGASIPLSLRVRLVETLQSSEVPYIEAGAFVSDKRVPAMADTEQLLSQLKPYSGHLAALVANESYFDRFCRTGQADTVALFVSASESHSHRKMRMTVSESLAAAVVVARRARSLDYNVRVHISGAFRDLTESNQPTDPAIVGGLCKSLRDVDDNMVLVMADTDARATADDIHRLLTHIGELAGLENIGVHLHERGGKAIENALVAWNLGVRIFDAAVGGVGGNPKALSDPVGNIATEELVVALEKAGATTGIKSEALLEAGRLIWEMCEMVSASLPPSRLLAERLGRGR